MITKFLDTTVSDVDQKGVVTVSANYIGNVDFQKDVSLSGSFNKTFKEHFNRARWYLNHDTRILLGVPIEGKQVGNEVHVTGKLNMAKEISRDTYEDYKLYAEYGKTLEHSIGVDAIKWRKNGDIREVSEWKLHEYSTLTSWGANEKTRLVDLKSVDDVSTAISWLETKLKKGNYTDEAFIEIEKQLNLIRSLTIGQPEKTTDSNIVMPSLIEIQSIFSTFNNSL